MNFRQRSYFWRLLYAFFAGGLVPFLLLALVLGTANVRILENAYRDRTADAVSGAAVLTGELMAGASDEARFLASSDAVRGYLASSGKDPRLLSEVNRLFSSASSKTPFLPFIIPLDGTPVLSRSPVPDEYRVGLYGGWGLLGELARASARHIVQEQSSLPGGPSAPAFPAVFFGQPHPRSGDPVPLAVGVPVLDGSRVAGYVVIDLDRRLFAERIGNVAGSGGALTNLFLSDPSGCVLYNMTDAQLESTFPAPAQGSSLFVAREEIPPGFTLTGTYPVQAARAYTGRINAAIFIFGAVSILVSLCMAILLSRTIARPVHLLTLTMERVSQGQLDARCPEPAGRGSGDELAVLVHRFNRTIDQVNELVANLVAQERELRRAETLALQAQINPHFLYNTLNSIRSMAKLQGATEIASMATSLAKIMREGAAPGGSFCTVGHGLSVARDYFAIEAWRWPGRFRLDEDIDPEILDARIPRLVIQPVVENALVHGLEEKPGDGVLSIAGRLVAGDVVITVTDNGAGIEPERLDLVRSRLREAGERPVESSLNGPPAEEDSFPSKSSGIALINTHRRLCLVYGLPYGLNIDSVPGGGTTVTICFPHEREEETRC